MIRILGQEDRIIVVDNSTYIELEKIQYKTLTCETYVIKAYSNIKDWVRIGYWKDEEIAKKELKNILTCEDGYEVAEIDFEVGKYLAKGYIG